MPSWTSTQSFAQYRQHVISLITGSVLCLSGAWLVTQFLPPAIVQAFPGRTDILVDVQPGETYNALLRRAEAIARTAVQRSFDQDILVNQASVTIVAQNHRGEVPILTLQVDRTGWRNRPDPRRWATYYSTSRKLLGLDTTPSTPAVQSVPIISTPGSATPKSPASPASPVGSGTATNTPSDPLSPATQTPQRPIIPERIPTPARIGK